MSIRIKRNEHGYRGWGFMPARTSFEGHSIELNGNVTMPKEDVQLMVTGPRGAIRFATRLNRDECLALSSALRLISDDLELARIDEDYQQQAIDARHEGWECGSCGAITDKEVVDPGDDYHDPDEDCRAVRPYTEKVKRPDTLKVKDWSASDDYIEFIYDVEDGVAGEYLNILAFEHPRSTVVNLDPDGVDALRDFLNANRGRGEEPITDMENTK